MSPPSVLAEPMGDLKITCSFVAVPLLHMGLPPDLSPVLGTRKGKFGERPERLLNLMSSHMVLKTQMQFEFTVEIPRKMNDRNS